MKKNIVLIGLSGCGKSTVGKLLAEALRLSFVDMDSYIEENEKRPIPEIFARFGESYFRDAETRAAKELAAATPKVIATGGGAVLRPETMAPLKESGICIFLDRKPEAIIEDVDASARPLLSQGKQVLFDLDKARRPLYERYADLTVSDTKDAFDATKKVLSLLK